MYSRRNRLIAISALIILSLAVSFIDVRFSVFFQVVSSVLAITLLLTLTEKRAEESIGSQSDFLPYSQSFSALIEQMPVPLLIVNNESQFLYATPSFKQLLIQPASKISECDVEMRTILNNALDQLTVEHFEVNYNFKVFNLDSKRIKQHQHLFIFTDITTQVSEERNARRFMADASHELKTPITAIKGITEVLLTNNETDVEIIQKFLKQIEIESERLHLMVTDMLLVSKLSQHYIVIEKKTFDLKDLVSQVEGTFSKDYEKKGIHLIVPGHSQMIYGDYEKILTIVNNLVSNALHYSEEGPVILKYYEKDNNTIIIVEDRGVGIAPENIPQLFERFYRVDNARNRKIGGSGLGLSITKQLVTEHGGTIEVDSKLGEGTKFVVSIPKS